MYSYYLGDCQQQWTDVIAPDYGGGSLIPNSVQAEMNALQQQFEEATEQKPLLDNDFIYCQPIPPNGNYYQQIIGWNVCEHFRGHWSVRANTSITYNKERFFNPITAQMNYVYHISEYNTNNSQYQGSQIIVQTTWQQTLKTDNILFNNSENAKGSTRIAGTIKQTMKTAITFLPHLNGEFRPSLELGVDRTVRIIPK